MDSMSSQMELLQQQGATLRRLCQLGDVTLVQHLIRSGAPIDAAQADGCTGLWLASEQGHVDVVQFLCAQGANVHLVKHPGDVTPLYVAAQNGHTNVVDVLLDHGAIPNAAKSTGATPLYIAAQQNFTDIVESLVRAGASVNIANSQGITPLCIAAFQGNLESVKVLLHAGADPTTKCGGKTAIEWAAVNGHGASVNRLIEQHQEERARDVERRQGLVRTDDVTPLQQWERQQRGGGEEELNRSVGQHHDVTASSTYNWYTPKYLVPRQSSLRSNTTNTRAVDRTLNVSSGSASPTPRHAPVGLASSPSSPSRAFSSWHRAPAVSSHSHGSRSIGERPAGLTPRQVEEEMQRNEAFRKQISRAVSGGAPGTLQAPPAKEGSGKASHYQVDQEWVSFKQKLSSEEETLKQSKSEVMNSWMYSCAAITQYEDHLRKLRQEQMEAIRLNREKAAQDQALKEKNMFTYPPLPTSKLDELRHFVAQGASAKGPPPPPADASAAVAPAPSD